MASRPASGKRTIQSRSKVKTGCVTCRNRKVKCDEEKPSCKKCVGTGRTCDGYSSPFRDFGNQRAKDPYIRSIVPKTGLPPTQFPSPKDLSEEISLLNRFFSTKTMFDVELPCDKEASQILEASVTDPAIRHAVSSLKALRGDLERSGGSSRSETQQNPSYHYGLHQYSLALRGLASKLSSPGPEGLKSALLCCQLLISIEQVRGNFAAMALHIIRGLKIMQEYPARPHLVTTDKVAPALYGQLPFLDVFIVKIFAAPCKFTEPSQATSINEMTSSELLTPPNEESPETHQFRPIAPNKRTELGRIATSTLALLEKVSHVQSTEIATQLISEKAALLNSLELWLDNLDQLQGAKMPRTEESFSVSFMRLFHLVLKIVLLGVLDSPKHLDDELRIANDRLQIIAVDRTERLRAQEAHHGSSSNEAE